MSHHPNNANKLNCANLEYPKVAFGNVVTGVSVLQAINS